MNGLEVDRVNLVEFGRTSEYVYLNLGSITADLEDLDRHVIALGAEDVVGEIKRRIQDRPYYMAEETEKILAGEHGIQDAIIVGTAHGDRYVIRRRLAVGGEYREYRGYTDGAVGGWLSDMPRVRETWWRPRERAASNADPDFRPVKTRRWLDGGCLRDWLMRFPGAGGYVKHQPGIWRSVDEKYRGMSVKPNLHETRITPVDFERYIEPLYPAHLGYQVKLYGEITGIENADEALALAGEMRGWLEEGDMPCDPVVHVSGYTDNPIYMPQAAKEPFRSSERCGENPDYLLMGEVVFEAQKLRAMRTEVQAWEAKAEDPLIVGRRREYVEKELACWRENLAEAESDFDALPREQVCGALLALDDEQDTLRSQRATVLHALERADEDEYQRWADIVGYEPTLEPRHSYALSPVERFRRSGGDR